jgi:hypothetical protein
MSSPVGFTLEGIVDCLGCRGDGIGDKDCSENVVVGDSAPVCDLEELQPKKDVNFPAGDLGLACVVSGDVEYGSSSKKSSVTPSNCNLRSGCLGCEEYNGIFGIVGERMCPPLLGGSVSSVSLDGCGACELLTDRSCLGRC